MKQYKADFHIHTVLSPCGSLEMSPVNIVQNAKEKGLDIIGITDHNATHHTRLIQELAAVEGIFVMKGVEVCTKEEIHCLAFFEQDDKIQEFQAYIDEFLPHIPNNPDKLGYQVVVDKDEDIIDELPYTLLSGLNQNINQVQKKVKELNGIFIPAHIDRGTFSLTSQLGFVPPDLNPDAFEISKFCSIEKILKQYPYISNKRITQDSDAHFIQDIGCVYNTLEIDKCDFENIRSWLVES
ncbi:PHP domain-containing protein [Bacteroidales bacterium OttesenSCG-928-L14]|nr:PHP domain-containing protein [Bacteroidales bacterium OttesenSCG-928-L14]